MWQRRKILFALFAGLVVIPLAYLVWQSLTSNKAHDHLQRAKASIQKQLLVQARREVEHALDHDDSNLEATLLAGRLARQLGDFQAAELHLQHARQLPGGNNETVQLEQYLLRAHQGQISETEKVLLAYIVYEKPEAELCLEARAFGFLHSTQLEDSQRTLAQWLKKSPKNIQALYCRGLVYKAAHDNTVAQRYFLRVIQIDPERDKARLYLAESYLDTGGLSEAVKHLELLKGRGVTTLRVKTALATCYAQLNRLDEAEQIVNGILEKSPDNSTALRILGKVRLEQNKLDKAEELFRKTLKIDPASYFARLYLVRCLREKGDPKADEEQEKLKQLTSAIDQIQKIMHMDLRKEPFNPDLHSRLGQLYFRVGDYVQGRSSFRNALRYAPKHQPTHQFLAKHYEEVGDNEAAAYHRSQLKP